MNVCIAQGRCSPSFRQETEAERLSSLAQAIVVRARIDPWFLTVLLSMLQLKLDEISFQQHVRVWWSFHRPGVCPFPSET